MPEDQHQDKLHLVFFYSLKRSHPSDFMFKFLSIITHPSVVCIPFLVHIRALQRQYRLSAVEVMSSVSVKQRVWHYVKSLWREQVSLYPHISVTHAEHTKRAQFYLTIPSFAGRQHITNFRLGLACSPMNTPTLLCPFCHITHSNTNPRAHIILACPAFFTPRNNFPLVKAVTLSTFLNASDKLAIILLKRPPQPDIVFIHQVAGFLGEVQATLLR